MKKMIQSINHTSQKKKIKTIFFVVCFGALFSIGCNKYQFITIDSNFHKNEKDEFVAEDDTLQMKYTFTGKDFPITLTIFNKLQQPIYFDRQKSMVIMNGEQITDAYDNGDQNDSIGPQSSLTVISNYLSDKFIPISHQDKTTNAVISTREGIRQIKIHVFTEENSPVYFTSALAFSLQKDLSSPIYYDHPFWVSDIYQTMDMVPANMTANQFSMQKTTGFATFMTYTGATALLVAILAASGTTPAEE